MFGVANTIKTPERRSADSSSVASSLRPSPRLNLYSGPKLGREVQSVGADDVHSLPLADSRTNGAQEFIGNSSKSISQVNIRVDIRCGNSLN